MSRVWKRTVLLVLLSILSVGALWLTPLQGLERSIGLPTLYALRGTRTPPDPVVIVALDAVSAQRLNVPRRPDLWPRRFHAELVDGLVRGGAIAIGFDLLFEQPGEPADDAALAASMARAGNVVLAERVVRHLIRADEGGLLGGVDRLIRPIPELADAAWVTAPFILPKTIDGVFEFWTFPTGGGGNPSMPVRLYERWSAAHGLGAHYSAGAGDRLALNLYGPFGTVPMIPYADALTQAREAGVVKGVSGKLVLVGLAESNQSLQFDAYRTPFSRPDGVDINGVELAATAIANMVERSSLVAWTGPRALALVLGWTALLAVIWGVARASIAIQATVVGLGLFGVGALMAFSSQFIWLPVVFPVLIVPLLVGGIGMGLKYRFARGRHRRLQKMLDLGSPSRLRARLASVLESQPEGRVVRAVCLSSDIAAYTNRSEGLAPDEARDMLNRYLAHFMPVVESHGGDVTDLVGDSLMSLWVTGEDDTQACRQAVAAALELDRCMNRTHVEGVLPTRFGLHVGNVFFGELGVGERLEIRPVGDVVNTASRIQSACKPLGVTVLASGEVARHIDTGQTRPLGQFRVKGKRESIGLVWVGEGTAGQHTRHFQLAVAQFAAGDLDAAADSLRTIVDESPDHGPARFYLKVCETPALREGAVVVLTRG